MAPFQQVQHTNGLQDGKIIEYLNNKSIENLASFLTAKPTEEDKINERYSEMQLRLETLQKIRMSIGECIVELKDKDYLIEAYEILNDVERNVWRYINEGKIQEVTHEEN